MEVFCITNFIGSFEKKLLVGTITLYIWMGMNLYTFISIKTKINFAANLIYVMVESLYLNNNLELSLFNMCNIAHVKTTKSNNFFIEKHQLYIEKLYI